MRLAVSNEKPLTKESLQESLRTRKINEEFNRKYAILYYREYCRVTQQKN